jgi:hypothetical protein
MLHGRSLPQHQQLLRVRTSSSSGCARRTCRASAAAAASVTAALLLHGVSGANFPCCSVSSLGSIRRRPKGMRVLWDHGATRNSTCVAPSDACQPSLIFGPVLRIDEAGPIRPCGHSLAKNCRQTSPALAGALNFDVLVRERPSEGRVVLVVGGLLLMAGYAAPLGSTVPAPVVGAHVLSFAGALRVHCLDLPGPQPEGGCSLACRCWQVASGDVLHRRSVLGCWQIY